MFSERGQSFEPFKMLIGAIFALLVLVIILGAVNYFQQLDQDVSRSRFGTGLQNAVRQPTGRVLIVENLQFRPDTIYTSASVGRAIGIDAACVEFFAGDSSAMESSPESVRFTKSVVTNAYILCNNENNPRSSCSSSCEVCCKVSFGRELEEEVG